MLTSRIVAAGLIAVTLAACDKPVPPNPAARPVRTVTVEQGGGGEVVSITGQVRAKDETSLAFRVDGRVIDRPVRVGDRVATGQVIARLDPQVRQNGVRAAEGNLSALEAQLSNARISFWRQQQLLKDGWTSRAKFDDAQHSVERLEAQVDAAQAQLRTAQEELSYTLLYADGPGVVTKVGAEPGEVVSTGRMVVRVARDGGRDAVFDVPEQGIRTGPRDPLVEIALTNDPAVKATGRVREIAPQADSNTRTYRVKVAITDPPEAMRLGATVTGRVTLAPPPGVELPASALTKTSDGSAVWVVDPQSKTVSPRKVEVLRYDATNVVIAHGVQTGDIVVTAGVQQLYPGQKVRLLGAG